MTRNDIVIERFMTERHGLSGNELVLFAILWRDSRKGLTDTSADYSVLSQEMAVSIPTVYACLRKLTERGLIVQKAKTVYEVRTLRS